MSFVKVSFETAWSFEERLLLDAGCLIATVTRARFVRRKSVLQLPRKGTAGGGERRVREQRQKEAGHKAARSSSREGYERLREGGSWCARINAHTRRNPSADSSEYSITQFPWEGAEVRWEPPELAPSSPLPPRTNLALSSPPRFASLRLASPLLHPK